MASGTVIHSCIGILSSVYCILAGFTGTNLVSTSINYYYNLFVSNTSGASWVDVSVCGTA